MTKSRARARPPKTFVDDKVRVLSSSPLSGSQCATVADPVSGTRAPLFSCNTVDCQNVAMDLALNVADAVEEKAQSKIKTHRSKVCILRRPMLNVAPDIYQVAGLRSGRCEHGCVSRTAVARIPLVVERKARK